MDTIPAITRATALARLATAREALRTVLAGTTEEALGARRFSAEWTALDLLRHIWVWNELCARCLDDWLGSRDWIITFADEDQFNLEMVAARAGASLGEILAGLEWAYQTYDATLAERSDEELAERAAAPWGQSLTRIELIYDELGHDLTHIFRLRDIMA